MKPSKLGKSPIETQKFSAAERYLEYTSNRTQKRIRNADQGPKAEEENGNSSKGKTNTEIK